MPHSIRVSEDGRVYVADRENNRVQVFTVDGDFVDQWTDFKMSHGRAHRCGAEGLRVPTKVPRISILNFGW